MHDSEPPEDISQEAPGAQEQDSPEKCKPLFRGEWADHLTDGQELPVGGESFLHDDAELTTKLILDFAHFSEQTAKFTSENIRQLFERDKEKVEEYLSNAGSDMDPYTYYLCYQVQAVTQQLLEVASNTPKSARERQDLYDGSSPPKLSELKGRTKCAERAALGQYLFQLAGVESSYMSGIRMNDAHSDVEFPVDHSFIVLRDKANPYITYIFDIAQPRSTDSMPRVLRTDVPFTYELFHYKRDLLVGAEEVIGGKRLWYGVGKPVAGRHHTHKVPDESESEREESV